MSNAGITDREEQIIRLRCISGRTYREIGEQFGITRQRVSQILARLGIRRHQRPKPTCRDCGTPVTGQSARCRRCSGIARTQAQDFTCSKCGASFTLRGTPLASVKASHGRTSTGQWCWSCRAARRHGPEVVACRDCGATMTLTGRAAYSYRYHLTHENIRGHLCRGCQTKRLRAGLARRREQRVAS